MLSDQDTITNILAWVDSRIQAEVTLRPDSNIHKGRLADIWNQVRDHLISLRSTPVYDTAPVSARVQVVTEAEVAAGVAAMCNGSGGGTEEIVRRILEAGLAASRVVPGALPATGDELPPAIEARLKVWLTLGAGLNPHTMNLVVRFARALAKKLADAETKYGYSDGWRSPEWMDECRVQLQEHVVKGDPRDVAAYCAFLWHHGASTTTPPNATVFSASEQG